jgi:hypothetical protein
MFGTEECERSIAQSALLPSKRNWESYLCDALGESYVPLRAHTLQAIHIICFVHRSIANLCSVVTSAAVACGAGNTLGNKGAVSIFLKICNSKILVVNAHLSAHQHAERKRNAEFRKISLQMPILLEQKDMESAAEGGPSVVDSLSTGDNNPTNSVDGSSQSPPPSIEVNNTIPTIINEGHIPSAVAENTVEESKLNITAEVSKSEPGDGIVPSQDGEPDEDDDAADGAEASPTPGIVRPISINNLASISTPMSARTIDKYADIVIFMGDLNYRIKGNRSIVDKLLAGNMYEVLVNNDQLKNNMKQNLVLENFIEPPLHFRPTYKFDRGTDIYDSGPKSRIPSWTDRIFYKNSEDIVCLAYNSDMSISTSDHKPVYASFMININTFVSLDANQQVVVSNSSDVKFTSESQVCTIM